MLLLILTIHIFFVQMLKKFISESFFNPILHIFPIILFLLLHRLYGHQLAWNVSFLASVILFGYVFFFYRSIYLWHLTSMGVFVAVGLLVGIIMNAEPQAVLTPVAGELIAIFFMLILLVFKKKISHLVGTVTSKKLSMQNNLNELIRMTNVFIMIFSFYSITYIFVNLFITDDKQHLLNFIFQLYAFLLILAIIYEFIRVFAIRGKLLKEEWLPIVNNQGREIGSVNYQTSIWSEENKYTHPIVRVIVVDGNKMFLRQHPSNAGEDASKWDNAISTHLRLGEKIPDCIRRITGLVYGTSAINPVFLSNYKHENTCEFQYVHLYVTCKLADIHPNPIHVEHVKWWTIQQINEELSSGIFTDNFLKEYEILQRSGLIESGKCQCDCKLRDEIDNLVS